MILYRRKDKNCWYRKLGENPTQERYCDEHICFSQVYLYDAVQDPSVSGWHVFDAKVVPCIGAAFFVCFIAK